MTRKILFPEMESEPDYSDVLRRLDLSLVLAKNDVEVERGVARALWDDHLSALAPGPRLMAIRSNPDLQTWGTFDLLLAEAKRITLERPVDAVDLASASPIFHAEYQGQQATFTFDGELLAGALQSQTALHLIREWAIAHREELEANWNRARAGEPLERIAPLD